MEIDRDITDGQTDRDIRRTETLERTDRDIRTDGQTETLEQMDTETDNQT